MNRSPLVIKLIIEFPMSHEVSEFAVCCSFTCKVFDLFVFIGNAELDQIQTVKLSSLVPIDLISYYWPIG